MERVAFGGPNVGIWRGACMCGEHNTSTQRGASLKTKICAYQGRGVSLDTLLYACRKRHVRRLMQT